MTSLSGADAKQKVLLANPLCSGTGQQFRTRVITRGVQASEVDKIWSV